MADLIAGQTTAMVITYNEGPNLRRCLDRLRWVPRILIIDSGSTDETLDVARQYSQVDIVERPFDAVVDPVPTGLNTANGVRHLENKQEFAAPRGSAHFLTPFIMRNSQVPQCDGCSGSHKIARARRTDELYLSAARANDRQRVYR